MEWIEVFVETNAMGLEIVAGTLYTCGLTGLQIEDENDFLEFLDNPDRDWDYIEEELVDKKKVQPTGITFYVRDNVNGREQLALVKGALLALSEEKFDFEIGSLKVSVKNVKEEDWANNWKKYFKPFELGKKLIIKPSWEEVAEIGDKIVLNIDPGHIFGTGTHETTQLCVELIEKYLPSQAKVLDIGCGSGILSIASLLLGAKDATAVDIDPNAIDIAYENSDRNAIPRETYHVLSGNILSDEGLHKQFAHNNFDLVEANIVADVIIALAPKVKCYLNEKGLFVASGIILERLPDVIDALTENGFVLLEKKTKKDWAALCFQLQTLV